jgi:hypothetical protein
LRAIGWHAPPGPRQNPGPHPSATRTIPVSPPPTCAGRKAALAVVATPSSNEELKKMVRNMMRLSFDDVSRGLSVRADPSNIVPNEPELNQGFGRATYRIYSFMK